MPKFACIVAGEIFKIATLPEQPSDIAHKNVVWLPYVEEDINEATTGYTRIIGHIPIIETHRVLERRVTVDISIADRRAQMEVSPYQARKALKDAGSLPAVLKLIASLDEADDARMSWEYATSIRRVSPFIVALGAALGLNEGQIDRLFEDAAKIV